jgi:quercetin dioxygenase-like cupin family protein
MPPQIEPSPRPEWSPLPGDGVAGVVGKVLVREWGFFIAMLRFEPGGHINEHAGVNDTVVICIDGEGWTSVAGEPAQLQAGQIVRWPRDVRHHLWTEGTTMTTLMFERAAGAAEAAPA